MSKREQLEEYFSQSLEVDTLLRLCPDDEDTIYQIVDLLVDTCATNRKMKNKKKACLATKSAQKPVTSCKSSRNTPERASLIFCWCLCSTVSDVSQMKRHLS